VQRRRVKGREGLSHPKIRQASVSLRNRGRPAPALSLGQDRQGSEALLQRLQAPVPREPHRVPPPQARPRGQHSHTP